jgi:hypothetical protein
VGRQGPVIWKSIWAVVASILAVLVATTLVDVVLHVTGVFPPLGERITDGQAAIATAYRVVFGVAGAWLTARLAPSKPMAHVVVLGVLGTAASIAGVAVTWNADLGPRWYAILLAVLAMPQTLLGGRLAGAARS